MTAALVSTVGSQQDYSNHHLHQSQQQHQLHSQPSILRSGAVLRDVFSVSRVLDPGTSLSLKCTASGNPLPQVTWTLDGSSLHESTSRLSVGDFVTKSFEVVSYVNISSLNMEDGGVYACMAANEISSVVHADRVDIRGDPVVRTMKPRVAIEGHALLLNCPYSGHPIDEVSWEHSKHLMMMIIMTMSPPSLVSLLVVFTQCLPPFHVMSRVLFFVLPHVFAH